MYHSFFELGRGLIMLPQNFDYSGVIQFLLLSRLLGISLFLVPGDGFHVSVCHYINDSHDFGVIEADISLLLSLLFIGVLIFFLCHLIVN